MNKKTIVNPTLLIWDYETHPPVGNWTTILWRGFNESDEKNVISMPILAEEQSIDLRSQYLAWIYDIGTKVVTGKRIIDYLELRDGFSYWWMTSLAQKFNASETSQVNSIIKLFAIEKLISENIPSSIILYSGNRNLAKTFEILSKKLNLLFKWINNEKNKTKHLNAKKIYHSLPFPLPAIIFFVRYVIKHLPLLLAKKPKISVSDGEITFIDVLVHLDKQAFTTHKFISNYWSSLVGELSKLRIKTNWFHIYYYQESIRSPLNALRLIRNFAKSSDGLQSHSLIESYLSFSVFLKGLKDYYRISRASFRFSLVNDIYQPAGSALNLWPLFKSEWTDSLRGRPAMMNCIRLALLEKIFSNIPYQKLGIYIQENQPWEMTLIHAWKTAGHGKLIGVPHTTVRFWDLRYFYDPRCYQNISKNVLPIPDLVAVNGPIAKKNYLDGCYPESQITEVEALRYSHLLKSTNTEKKHILNEKSLNILICGDFLAETNYKMLSWLAIAAKSLSPDTTYVLKPHPAYPINLRDFSSLKIKITNAPLSEALMECDVTFTSNITSTAVDAYCSGVSVIQMLDSNAFNMSPLRSLKGLVYVTNPKELVKALLSTRLCLPPKPDPYFYLDEKLPKWKALLVVD